DTSNFISSLQPQSQFNRITVPLGLIATGPLNYRKYLEYLATINSSINKLYNSNKSAYNPENSTTMYQVGVCKDYGLKEIYIELNEALVKNLFYENINI
ncbi:1596_t:CDS:2, partial [Dentiscutata erythropus]